LKKRKAKSTLKGKGGRENISDKISKIIPKGGCLKWEERSKRDEQGGGEKRVKDGGGQGSFKTRRGGGGKAKVCYAKLERRNKSYEDIRRI